MTITTEEAEAHATALERGSVLYRTHAACALRTLAAERDIANKQIYGLAEERERWKARSERAEAEAERLREALRLVERFYYMEGKDAGWRAAKMNGIAREAQSPEPNLARFHRFFTHAALEGGDNER